MDTDNERDGLSFDRDVKPLFRERDRGSMLATFDLWQRDDVAENADAILKALEDGSMPSTERGPPSASMSYAVGSMPECLRNATRFFACHRQRRGRTPCDGARVGGIDRCLHVACVPDEARISSGRRASRRGCCSRSPGVFRTSPVSNRGRQSSTRVSRRSTGLSSSAGGRFRRVRLRSGRLDDDRSVA